MTSRVRFNTVSLRLEGWISKRGSSFVGRKSWKRRYFTIDGESAELRYFEVPFDPDSDEVTPDLPVTSLRGVVCVTGGTVSLIPHTSDTKDWIAVKCADGSGTPGRELVLTTFVPSDGKALFRALTAIAAGESLSSLHTAWKVSFPLIFGAALVEDLPASGGNAPDSQGAVSGESPKTATTAASSKSLAAQVGPSSHWGPQSVKDLADLSGSVPAAAALALVFRRLWNLTQAATLFKPYISLLGARLSQMATMLCEYCRRLNAGPGDSVVLNTPEPISKFLGLAEDLIAACQPFADDTFLTSLFVTGAAGRGLTKLDKALTEVANGVAGLSGIQMAPTSYRDITVACEDVLAVWSSNTHKDWLESRIMISQPDLKRQFERYFEWGLRKTASGLGIGAHSVLPNLTARLLWFECARASDTVATDDFLLSLRGLLADGYHLPPADVSHLLSLSNEAALLRALGTTPRGSLSLLQFYNRFAAHDVPFLQQLVSCIDCGNLPAPLLLDTVLDPAVGCYDDSLHAIMQVLKERSSSTPRLLKVTGYRGCGASTFLDHVAKFAAACKPVCFLGGVMLVDVRGSPSSQWLGLLCCRLSIVVASNRTPADCFAEWVTGLSQATLVIIDAHPEAMRLLTDTFAEYVALSQKLWLIVGSTSHKMDVSSAGSDEIVLPGLPPGALRDLLKQHAPHLLKLSDEVAALARCGPGVVVLLSKLPPYAAVKLVRQTLNDGDDFQAFLSAVYDCLIQQSNGAVLNTLCAVGCPVNEATFASVLRADLNQSALAVIDSFKQSGLVMRVRGSHQLFPAYDVSASCTRAPSPSGNDAVLVLGADLLRIGEELCSKDLAVASSVWYWTHQPVITALFDAVTAVDATSASQHVRTVGGQLRCPEAGRRWLTPRQHLTLVDGVLTCIAAGIDSASASAFVEGLIWKADCLVTMGDHIGAVTAVSEAWSRLSDSHFIQHQLLQCSNRVASLLLSVSVDATDSLSLFQHVINYEQTALVPSDAFDTALLGAVACHRKSGDVVGANGTLDILFDARVTAFGVNSFEACEVEMLRAEIAEQSCDDNAACACYARCMLCIDSLLQPANHVSRVTDCLSRAAVVFLRVNRVDLALQAYETTIALLSNCVTEVQPFKCSTLIHSGILKNRSGRSGDAFAAFDAALVLQRSGNGCNDPSMLVEVSAILNSSGQLASATEWLLEAIKLHVSQSSQLTVPEVRTCLSLTKLYVDLARFGDGLETMSGLLKRVTSDAPTVELCDALTEVAGAFLSALRPQMALHLLRESVTMVDAVFGSTSVAFAVLNQALGDMLCDCSSPSEALMAYLRAVSAYQACNEESLATVRLWTSLANVHMGENNITAAIEAHNAALAAKRALYGEAHHSIVLSLRKIALLQAEHGNLQDSRRNLQAAVATAVKACGECSEEHALALQDLGSVLADLGQLSSAAEAYSKSADVWMRRGEEPKAADAYFALGAVWKAANDPEPALAAHTSALRLRRKEEDGDVVALAASLFCVGSLKAELGMLSEAVDDLQAARELQYDLCGHDADATVETQRWIDVVQDEMAKEAAVKADEAAKAAKSPEASAAVRDVSKVVKVKDSYWSFSSLVGTRTAASSNSHGKASTNSSGSHSKTAPLRRGSGRRDSVTIEIPEALVESSVGVKADVMFAQGNLDDALSLYQNALDTQKAALGCDHIDLAASLQGLANVYYEQGKYDAAGRTYSDVLAIQRSAFGSDSPAVATTLNNLASVKYVQDDWSNALSLYGEAYEIQVKLSQGSHIDTATSLNGIANVLYMQGKYDTALEYYQAALAIQIAWHGGHHMEVATTQHYIACVLSILKRFGEACEAYKALADICEDILGEDDDETLSARANAEECAMKAANAVV